MDTPTFIAKWSKSQLTEQAASQSHFNDLCALVGVKNPIEADPIGDTFTFEKGAKVAAPASIGSKGTYGRADVWYKGHFAWEYKRKGKYKDLSEAYRQLEQYGKALDNPPLMVVCDITNYEIHTNFTGYKSEVYSFTLDELSDPDTLLMLKRVFTDPDWFKPTETVAAITEKIASKIGTIAQALRDRGHEPHDAAHFLMKVMFCLFAEDVELLPKELFQQILTKSKDEPARLKKQMDQLFGEMKTGGIFGTEDINWFNGGLFDSDQSIELNTKEIEILIDAAIQDWSAIEPSILGTLFERSLDPAIRSQIGANYTSREDIMMVIEPVIVKPLRKKWDDVRSECESTVETRSETARQLAKGTLKKGSVLPETYTKRIEKLLFQLQDHLASVRVLDPACGSGNFLYVAIQQLLKLELEILIYAANIGTPMTPRVRPTQLYGIEINTYASELAQVAIWIGYLQWMHRYGFNAPRDPILEPIDTIENRDAILAWADEDGETIRVWREGAKCLGKAKWPEADFIVGNPPFLGGQNLISGTKASKNRPAQSGLGEIYVGHMHTNYDIPATSDLCCYWFERACSYFGSEFKTTSAGLLATQGIRGVANRSVLSKINRQIGIFEAWSDHDWVLNGAEVHVSIICFSAHDVERTLNGKLVRSIGDDLRTGVDVTIANALHCMKNIAMQGPVKVGKFELDWESARSLLATPTQSGNSPADVLMRYITGGEISDLPQGEWIIDFDGRLLDEASQYDGPLAHIQKHVKPKRMENRDERRRERWWLHGASGSKLKQELKQISRYIVCSRHMKDWTFRFVDSDVFPDSGVIAIARDDYYFFGLIQSSIHEIWGRAQVSQVREAESGFRYTSKACMNKFATPWSPGHEPTEGDPQRALHDSIGQCAATLNETRERWLNPPEWVQPIADRIDAKDDFADVLVVSGEETRRLIRQVAIDLACANDLKIKTRTLTNLYNERPVWLPQAHKALDEAVLAAYGAVDPDGHWDTAWAEVFEETGAGQPLPEGHDLIERREEVEQLILGNLLRMNQERA